MKTENTNGKHINGNNDGEGRRNDLTLFQVEV